jgi:hypothetical protein
MKRGAVKDEDSRDMFTCSIAVGFSTYIVLI